MASTQTSYVRTQMIAAEPPPPGVTGVAHWLKTNLFATTKDTILTVIALLLLAWYVPQMLNWLFFDAQWTGTDRTFCATVVQSGGSQPEGWSGACWAFIGSRFDQFIFGRYPIDERWRPTLVGISFVALLVPLLIPKVPYKGWNAILLFAVLPIVSFFLLVGGVFGLRHVETSLWGGLMVTLILSFVGMAVSFPLGILLALGRRSPMPVIKTLCVTFIEIVRGVPLITVLFMASVMLPLFMPQGVTVDRFLRALIGFSIFASAYMAEVIRGGLQAIPKGQYEGADSLGFSYWQKTGLIVLPQAIKIVIPGIVNTFIGMFKDTSLVSIIGMFDLLGIIRQNFADVSWASPVTPLTGLIFAGFVFWIFCFGMSRYSMFVERRLDTGHKR
ncbi:amino acid ABC transporter permease [Rhizobium sp. GN54]|uniref:amino acid ABC transporter permease n=1 Tax=Rhizobium sp. GN54 TaxID=2898150 RepID=UPI001E4E1174|nr:amino acid ABC transporter permease [Rhizobium sp. GN54]MCD2185246.1 amino acid ABC transporter permease [Rhizobium sp. GN54]